VTAPEQSCGAGVLTALGMSAQAEAVWRQLVMDPDATETDLCIAAAVRPNVLTDALTDLMDAQLIIPAETPSGFAAIDPSLAIEAFVARGQREVAARTEALTWARSQVADLAGLYALARTGDGSVASFEIVTDIAEIRHQIGIAASRERTENRSLALDLSIEGLDASFDVDDSTLSRGVKQRTIVSADALTSIEAFPRYERLARRGEEVRTLESVPFQMVVFDLDLAVLPVDPHHPATGAMFIRANTVVAALALLFDQLWIDARPIFTPTERLTFEGRRGRVLELVAAGNKDERIARSLGVGTRTIRRDIAELKSELGASSRTEIVAAAVRKGLL